MIKACKCVTVIQELYCDDCEVKMEQQPIAYKIDPMEFDYIYVYKCPKCGKTTTTTENYPQIRYINLEEIKNFNIVDDRGAK